jgi:hypothetical protein
METVKTIITLLGRRAQENFSVAQPVNELPHSKWLMLFWKNRNKIEPAAISGNNVQVKDVFIRHASHGDLLHFNLPQLTHVLVTVYSFTGEILSIQSCQAHRNSMMLELGKHQGNYIVRVQLNYNRYRYAS